MDSSPFWKGIVANMGCTHLLKSRWPAWIVAVWMAHAWPCFGQQPAPAAGAAAVSMQGGQVDLQRSRSYARVGASGFGHEHGVEGRLNSGSIRLGVEQQAGQLVFDMKSFACDTPAARQFFGLSGTVGESTQQQTTANMTGPEVLNVSRFPTATFVIRSSRAFPKKQPTDPQWYQLDGDFTLHGVTRPLKINAIAEATQGSVRLRGQFSVLQTQYGITPFSRAFGTVGVADEIKIQSELWLGPQ